MVELPRPRHRPRRLRRSPALRALVRETSVEPARLVQPLFIRENRRAGARIPSMPGIRRLTVDEVPAETKELLGLDVSAVLLFGVPAEKDPLGQGAYDEDGVVQTAIRNIKEVNPDIVLMSDVCLCGYTDHGHCGVIRGGGVDNDATVELLAKTAVSHARAGVDIVAPSAMMDGQVAGVRAALDREGFEDTAILAYAAKHASAFYGPFRDAADSAPRFGDRRGYQKDPANLRESLREIALDLEEGADIVMVKPALPYLDVIRAARERFDAPLAAYAVSGEYAMIKAAADRGWIDERAVVEETLTAIRRAGADFILTYHAKDFARWREEGSA
ncbi:MAG: porphobilinogen synthase [Methanobacteriota archaeon]|nr:MAG: porphobilinogen synthase [Euryarchaeota archaeon]TLZ94326.1 MAG: porphobilinogen synthase [Euryarchaeota archaeon]